ncbi:MAG: HAMP domain-containing protein [Verrucomicrobia bacterium]|nr:HAMP domain-containing protein [Verrucomicrobiota bacterium]
MHPRRIFWQIYPSYLIVTLLSLTAVFLLSSSAISRFYHRQTAKSLNVQARFSEELVRARFDAQHIDELSRISETLGEKTPARITFILPDGTVAGDSDKAPDEMGNHRDRPEVKDALAGHTGQSIRYSNTLKKNMMYVAVPVHQNGNVMGVVRTSMPLTELDLVIDAVQRRIIIGGLVILLMAALFSLFVSRRISRPLERIKLGAERFAAGDFSHRLHSIGSTEIGSLAETMNQMAAQLEERLQTVSKERNQREAVLSSMVEGVLAVDTTGHIISMNKAAAKFFSVFQPDTVTGRSLEEVFRNVKLQRFVGEVLEGQETRECEITVQNNQAYYLQARGTNLLGVQGSRIGAVVVFNDVSRLRRLENLRRDFVANVSHELKTPITSIKGFVETLLDGAMNDPAERERFLKIVAKHADRLNAIIEDLLMLSRLEQDGNESVEMQPAALSELLHSAVEVCAHRAAKKDITIQIQCPDDLSAVVNPPLIEQALINLIGNALKYSADGKTVTVSARAAEEGGVLLRVNDQGYGIEPEHLERLFERFYRVDKGRSRQEGGTGLGLAIVKHIAQAHGGTISVESTFGKGSAFSIFLPGAE